MAPPRSLAGAAIAATAAAIILSCNLSLFPHLIVSSSKFPASTSPPSPTCLSHRLVLQAQMRSSGRAGPRVGGVTGGHCRVRAQQVRSRWLQVFACSNLHFSSSWAISSSGSCWRNSIYLPCLQSLRALSQLEPGSDEARPTKAAASASYPLAPIGTVESCFSTRCWLPSMLFLFPSPRSIQPIYSSYRSECLLWNVDINAHVLPWPYHRRNGTPRQPLVVTLARATLVLDPARVPAAALEGLASYSHCWILYVFHLNTDLDKLWKDPARSKLKAKVWFCS